MTTQIESGITAPRKRSSLPKTYPFDRMGIGDSFFRAGDCRRTQRLISQAIWYYQKTHPATNFTVRQTTENGIEGARVWRLDDITTEDTI